MSSSSSSSGSSIFPAPSHTRLVTICAHVDHGKTTLADNLIERNGIISERLAGTVRFLDSLEEEQRRGITMRSSAIGLKHRFVPPKKNKSSTEPYQDMIVHLLDSPGHTDFSQEVSSSLQCCDNALLVVDAVEGMCARTHQVLREAHMHQLVPILLINKIDSLCTTLRLSPNEAYIRIRTLLETINAASSAMLTSSRTQTAATDTNAAGEETEKDHKQSNNNAEADDHQKEDEQLWIFEPMKGNVIFASALFGWGFSIPSLARSLFRSKSIPLKPLILKQCLFGDYKYRPEDQKVIKLKHESSDETLFAQYALGPLWDMYEGIETAAASVGITNSATTSGSGGTSDNNNNTKHNKSRNNNNSNKSKITSDTPGMIQVVEAMKVGGTNNSAAGIPTSLEDIQAILKRTGANTEEAIARALIRRYRPLSDAVLDVLCEYGPSPLDAIQSARKLALKFDYLDDNGEDHDNSDESSSVVPRIQQAISTCDPSPSVPTVAHVCKFMATDILHVNDPELIKSISDNNNNNSNNKNQNLIMGLARVFSGTLKTGSEYYFMGGGGGGEAVLQKKSIRLYLLMGSSFVKVNEVPAGHLCAIYNLEDLQLKTVTLCDTIINMPNRHNRIPILRGIDTGVRPLVKVNVECVDTNDIDRLERGLLKLSLADASVEVTANAKGERILACLGEIHLEQSILDLKNVYCGSGGKNDDNSGGGDGGNNNSDDDNTIRLRVSDPIVEFGETTDWFFALSSSVAASSSDPSSSSDNNNAASGGGGDGSRNYHSEDGMYEDYETVGFGPFFDNTKKLTRLRQVSVPPYNEEEGLQHASFGRARSIVFGKCAAISLRVIPLLPVVYRCLKKRRVLPGSEECLHQIGQALMCSSSSTTTTTAENEDNDDAKKKKAEDILLVLSDCLCSLDGNGNAIVESQNITNGICVKGIDTSSSSSSSAGEVYVPQQQQQSTNNEKKEKDHGGGADDDDADNDDEGASSLSKQQPASQQQRGGVREYELVKQRIRDHGLVRATSKSSSLSPSEEENDHHHSNENNNDIDSAALQIWKNEMRSSAVAGFELAVRAGPICEEPLRSVMVILEGVEIAVKTATTTTTSNDTATTTATATATTNSSNSAQYRCAKPLNSGMVVASIRSGIRCCLLTRPARLMECHLKLTLHASLNSLGSLYSVLSKRRGKVIEDTMVDGTDLLMITATLPQAESFDLARELYRKTSGQVTAPELVFSHWERFDVDPFWIPTSQEEREDYGEVVTNAGDSSTGIDNTAINYIRQVRERKGLVVDSNRTVVAAEKQRTRKR